MSTQLPPDLVNRMQRLAEKRTLDSRPFPAVDRAIQRKRVNRFAGVAAATAVVAAVAAGVVVADSWDRSNTSAPASVHNPPAQTLAEAGYPAQTSGSLGKDAAWLKALRQKVFAKHKKEITALKDVRVVAAGDVQDKMRFAEVLYPRKADGWGRQLLVGPPGAKPKAMHAYGDGSEYLDDGVPADTEALFSTAGDRAGKATGTGDPMVIVLSPRARSASTLTKHTLEANGSFTSKRRDLPSVAQGVWADTVTDGEYLLADVQADGKGPSSVDGGGRNLRTVDESGDSYGFDYLSVAPAGTTLKQLRPIAMTFSLSPMSVAPSIDEEPVYAAGIQGDGGEEIAVALLRAPSGAYMFSLMERDISPGGVSYGGAGRTGTLPAGPEPGQVMVGARTRRKEQNAYVVLAPEGAVKVRIGEITVDVHNRLAFLTIPAADDSGPTAQRVQALDSAGSVIGETTPSTNGNGKS